MNILVSSAGRRGALIKLAKQTLFPLGGRVFACDAGNLSSACRLADDWAVVPRCLDPEFPEVVLKLCRRWDIQVIIPTIDTELAVYARHRDEFRKQGILVGVSGEKAIEIGGDKATTYAFLTEKHFPTVKQYSDFNSDRVPPLPVIIKPRFGSASNGVHLVEDEDAFHFYLGRTHDPVVQEVAQGAEYTVNFFVGAGGSCLAAVPHRRIETRGGEVSKSVTERHVQLISLADRFAAELPDAFGPLCFQAFVQPDGKIQIIELNCRFGGGYPMAHASGVNFIQWLLDEAAGISGQEKVSNWQSGLTMLRWDDAVFVEPEGLAA